MFDHGQIAFVNSSLVILDLLVDTVILDEFETNNPIKENFQRRKITFTFQLQVREGIPLNTQNRTK